MGAHNSPVSAQRNSVANAVLTRRSTRAFLDRPVERDLIAELLEIAARAPSGGNLQPWHVDVVAGTALEALKAEAKHAFTLRPAREGMELSVYPAPLGEPYRTRRHASGEALYAALGMGRDDRPGRLAQFARNFDGFGAPVMLFFSIDRMFDRPQWAHLGMFMQNVMLLAVERGLATCPQEAWAAVHATVSRFLQLPPERIFYCGMALGYADPDHPINRFETGREPLGSFARFHGF
jgi:nitroreductase